MVTWNSFTLPSTILPRCSTTWNQSMWRTVEISFAEGGLEYSGNTVPFPGGTFSAVVAEGDAVSAWRDSGLTLKGGRLPSAEESAAPDAEESEDEDGD